MKWKVGDWVIFDLRIGQITRIDGNIAEFSDGTFRTSGRLLDRFRPISLENKVIIETLDYYYNAIHNIDGEAGFNFPDINSHFCQLALDAIDNPKKVSSIYEKAKEFINEAEDYRRVIQGISLFRPRFK